MLVCFDPGFLRVCTHLLPFLRLLCEPIALLPRYPLEYDRQIWEQRSCAREDEWVESPRVMVFFHIFLCAVRHLA